MLTVKVINRSTNPLPSYQTSQSAGLDLMADLVEKQVLKKGERALIGTGLFMELPQGYEAQIRPRSGLALNRGVTVLNSPGTVDADYRGEIKVVLINHSEEDLIIKPGDRIAQMVINKYEKIQWSQSQELEETDRGEGGYGHTGV